jgi:hypothetical protein
VAAEVAKGLGLEYLWDMDERMVAYLYGVQQLDRPANQVRGESEDSG